MFIAGLLILISLAPALNVFALGESAAFSLGVDVEKVKMLAIVSASMMTAAAVSFAGLIGFVGLMIPHIFRLIGGPDNRTLLPMLRWEAPFSSFCAIPSAGPLSCHQKSLQE
jgi:iron complex transport system permease protein